MKIKSKGEKETKKKIRRKVHSSDIHFNILIPIKSINIFTSYLMF